MTDSLDTATETLLQQSMILIYAEAADRAKEETYGDLHVTYRFVKGRLKEIEYCPSEILRPTP